MADSADLSVVTPPVRLSFPQLSQPRAIEEGQTPTFSASLLFDKSAQQTKEFKRMKKLVDEAVEQKWGKNKPNRLRRPFLTIDDLKRVYDGYEEEHVILRVKTTIQPGLVNQRNEKVVNVAEEFYPGCWVRAAMHAYAWDHKTGGEGVSFGLDHLQKWADDEPFGKRSKPEDVFDQAEGDDEDEDGDDPL